MIARPIKGAGKIGIDNPLFFSDVLLPPIAFFIFPQSSFLDEVRSITTLDPVFSYGPLLPDPVDRLCQRLASTNDLVVCNPNWILRQWFFPARLERPLPNIASDAHRAEICFIIRSAIRYGDDVIHMQRDVRSLPATALTGELVALQNQVACSC